MLAPGKTGNPEFASFSLARSERCMLYCQQTDKTHSIIITWSQLNHPLSAKQSTIVCTRQSAERHNMPTSITIFIVYQVCHDVGRCVKMGIVLRRAWSESQCTVLVVYYYLKCQLYQTFSAEKGRFPPVTLKVNP